MPTELHVSVAVATPVALVFVLAGHCKVRFGGQAILGAVVSRTVIVCVQLVLLPQRSVAVQVRKMILAPPQVLLVESPYVRVTWLQIPWAVATPVAFVRVSAGHSKLTSAGQLSVGPTLLFTSTFVEVASGQPLLVI